MQLAIMKLIAHRGNLEGSNPAWENRPLYIDIAIDRGFDVEVDLWLVDGNRWMLGHDEPTYPIDIVWLRNRRDRLWVHCKNVEALVESYPWANCFWHQHDAYTLTSRAFIWTEPGYPYTRRSVVVDLLGAGVYPSDHLPHGICTDYPLYLRSLLPQ